MPPTTAVKRFQPLRREHAAVLASGGVESGALFWRSLELYARVTPIYIRTGARWEAAELRWARRLAARIESPRFGRVVVLDVPVRDVYRRHWSLTGWGVPGARSADPAVYLPGRNILLLSKAAVYAASAGITTLLLGTLKNNPFPDASPAFFSALADALARGLDVPLRIETPFRDFQKRDVLREVQDVPWELTFSCIKPVGIIHCGGCNKCAERQRAFKDAGMADPTRYAGS